MQKQKKILLLLFLSTFFFGETVDLFGQENTGINDTVISRALYYNDLGVDKYSVGDIDSCLIYLDKAAVFAEQEENWDLLTIANSNIYAINYMNGDYEAADKEILRSERILKEYLKPNSKAYIQACDVLGAYYKERGNYNIAIEYYNRVIEADSTNDEYWILAMGKIQGIYAINGDYEKALICQNEVREFIANSNEDNTKLLPNIYLSLGEIYKGKQQRDSAQVYFLKSKKILDKLVNNKNRGELASQVINLISLIEFSLEDENTNLNTIELLKEFEKLYDEKFRYRRNELFLKKALFYQAKGKIELVDKNLVRAKVEAEDIYTGYDKHPALAKAYEYDAKFLFNRGEYSTAITELDHAFYYATISNLKDEFNEYYSPSSFLDSQQGIRFLKLRIKCLEALYDETNDLEQLQKAGRTYENLSDLVLHLRDLVQNQSSELDWSRRLTEVYRGAVENAILLYEKTSDFSYLEKAFLYSECNKAATLAEKVSYEKTLKNILPEEILKQLKDLRIDMAFYQKQINSGQQKVKQDSTKIAEWKQIVKGLETEYKSLEKETKRNYPDYAKASLTFKPSTVEELRQSLLEDNSALIEYFSTDDAWYVFTLTSDDLGIQEIVKDETFNETFTRLIESVSKRPKSSTYLQDLKDFRSNSHKLFDILLKESIADLSEKVTNLLIIPDGQLTHLPFELLLTELPEEDENLSYQPTAMPYLFNRFNLNYGFSATVANLTNQNKSQENTGIPAIFAPSFSDEYLAESRSCQEGGLSYLKCNAKEGELINDLVSGEFFKGDAASIQSFRDVAANAPILHLATHACIDEENLGENKIFFADSYVTTDDLNTLGVNADIVVLSACDTGLGMMIEGEGLMSLSRGFLCAGAASTVMSLWSVDDCATSDLMVSFYEGLKAGENKSTALKNAKLTYLSQADKLHQHPYFWAPFVLSGNINSIELASSTSQNILYLGGAVLFLLFAFWTYRKVKL